MPTVELEKPQTFAAFEGKVSGNTVKGVSLLQKGPALGHGMWVDNVMLEQAKKCAAAKGKIKAKLDHWSSLDKTVGYYENFRIRAGKLVADLNLFESSPQTAQLLEMIESIPESFGVSIVFAGDEPEYDKEEDRYYARVRELYSADFVDTPAANRDGVFEAEIDSVNGDMANDHISKADFDAYKAASEKTIADLKSEFEAKIAELSKPTPPAPAPEPPKPDTGLAAEVAELKTLLKAFQIAPPSNQPPAPIDQPETPPAPAKSYADARKEAIGDATGLARIKAAREFEAKFPNEAAYLASFKK